MNKMKLVEVKSALGWELNVLVALAKGMEVAGWALCHRDPESGCMEVDMDQVPRDGVLMATERRPVYVRTCVCDVAPQESTKLFNHDWQCLEPVPDYVNDHAQLWGILTGEGISLMRTYQVNGRGMEWRATPDPKEPGPRRWSYGEADPAVALLRQFVASKLGDYVKVYNHFLEGKDGAE